MKSKLWIGVIFAVSMASISAGDAREHAVLMKMKGRYKELDKAMETLNPENIVKFFAKGGIMIGGDGSKAKLQDAAIDMCSRFKLKQSATARTYVKQFKMVNSKTVSCLAKIKMTIILPKRGKDKGTSKVEFESTTRDVWSYTKQGWLMSKSTAISDKMKVDGKPYNPNTAPPVDDGTSSFY